MQCSVEWIVDRFLVFGFCFFTQCTRDWLCRLTSWTNFHSFVFMWVQTFVQLFKLHWKKWNKRESILNARQKPWFHKKEMTTIFHVVWSQTIFEFKFRKKSWHFACETENSTEIIQYIHSFESFNNTKNMSFIQCNHGSSHLIVILGFGKWYAMNARLKWWRKEQARIMSSNVIGKLSECWMEDMLDILVDIFNGSCHIKHFKCLTQATEVGVFFFSCKMHCFDSTRHRYSNNKQSTGISFHHFNEVL